MRIIKKYIHIFLIGLLGLPFLSAAAWYNANWTCRILITNTSPALGGDLTNYPLPVVLTGSSAAALSNARADGFDICFTGSNGTTLLSHEIEYFTNIGGSIELNAWVKIPAIAQNTVHTMYLYCGNPASANMQDSANTWNAGYVMVHHLNQSNTATMLDSTGNALNGTTNAVLSQGAAGIIGKGLFLTGNDKSYVTFGNGALLQQSNALSAQLWINASELKAVQFPMAFGDTGFKGWIIIGPNASSTMEARGGDAVSTQTFRFTPALSPTGVGNWHMVSLVFNGSTYTYYLNDVPQSSVNNSSSNIAYTGLADDFFLGNASGLNATRYYHGFADELRYSSNAKNAAWVKADYLYIASNSQYIKPGLVQYTTPQARVEVPAPTVVGIPLIFSNTSTGGTSMSGGTSVITNSVFMFSDGSAVTNTGSESNAMLPVTKTFNQAGASTNLLIVIDDSPVPRPTTNRFVLSLVDYVHPKLYMYWVPAEPVVGQYVRFIANSSATYGTVTNWQIDFGTGSKYIWRQYMTNHPVAYRYPYSGDFAVRFSVVDQYGYSNVLTLTNSVTDYGARDVTKMSQRVFKYGRDFPLIFKYRLTGTARKVQLRIIHMNGMILRNLGFKEAFEGEDLIFTWDGKTQWDTYLTHPPCFLRYDVYSEDGFIETKIEVIVVY